eukprot:2373100-Rhodomonas_salina.1
MDGIVGQIRDGRTSEDASEGSLESANIRLGAAELLAAGEILPNLVVRTELREVSDETVAENSPVRAFLHGDLDG